MKCPFCKANNDKVLDSREGKHGSAIRRRRECLECSKRFTTYERIGDITNFVIKKDQRREAYDRNKVLSGILKAGEKRPIPNHVFEEIADYVEQEFNDRANREVSTDEIGERIMDRLAKIDDVAYVRFASVYRQFKDITQFMEELQGILHRRTETPK